MPTDVQVLCEMGFPQNRAEKALAKTGYKGVQIAMDWIMAHEEDPDIDDPMDIKNPEGNVLGKSSDTPEENTAASGEAAAQAKSLKCDECGKLLKTELDAQAHAARTQHASFSESVEEIKPLTEEEKAAQKEKLLEKMKAKRQEKEEQDRKEQIQREKMRRATGKDMTGAKQKLEEAEMRKIAEERRREKMEEKMARERVKEEIARDRAERAAKFSKSPQSGPSPSQSASTNSASGASSAGPSAKKEYTDTRLQIRLTDGSALTQSFKVKESLAAVRVFVTMNRTDGNGPFSLTTTFPRKVFTDEDMDKPLSELGLVPSAVLVVCKPQ